MSRRVCGCGRDATEEKPLIINIRTCKKRHGDPSKSKQKVDETGESFEPEDSELFIMKSEEFKPEESKLMVSDSRLIEKSTTAVTEPSKSKAVLTLEALPVLTSRFHGPGCAIEVEVLERHEFNCPYRKDDNPYRNNLEDRCGSYEAINRVTVKTCQGIQKSSEPPIVNAFYSMVDNLDDNLFIGVPLKSTTPEQREMWQSYVKKKEYLDNLVKSSKSFVSDSSSTPSRHTIDDIGYFIGFTQTFERSVQVDIPNR